MIDDEQYNYRATRHLLTLVDNDGTKHYDSFVPTLGQHGKNWVFIKNGKYYIFDNVEEGERGDNHIFIEYDVNHIFELYDPNNTIFQKLGE